MTWRRSDYDLRKGRLLADRRQAKPGVLLGADLPGHSDSVSEHGPAAQPCGVAELPVVGL